MTTTRETLAARVADRCDLPRQEAAAMVGKVLDLVAQVMATGETVTLSGFGTFRSRLGLPRKGRDPRTGLMVDIPAAWKVRFTPSRTLAARIAEGAGDPRNLEDA